MGLSFCVNFCKNYIIGVITVVKNTVNTIVVTLTENSTVYDPIYLFRFTNQQSLTDYYFISIDTSQFKNRYNEFQLEEKPNADTLAGEVTLGNEGFYNYIVYQTDLLSLSGLTEASEAVPNIVKEVENGLVYVVMTAQTNITYTPPTVSTIVYQPTN